MNEEEKADTPQPVFHGAPSRPEPPAQKDNKLDRNFAAGVAVGIGSAALVAALLYARKAKTKPPPRPAPEPSD